MCSTFDNKEIFYIKIPYNKKNLKILIYERWKAGTDFTKV